MTIIKDKNNNILLKISDKIEEDFVLIEDKKFKILKKFKEKEDEIIVVNTSLLLEN